jgi:PAS domain S-box-containing protein
MTTLKLTDKVFLNICIFVLIGCLAALAITHNLWSLALISATIAFLQMLWLAQQRQVSTLTLSGISFIFASFIVSVIILSNITFSLVEAIITVILPLTIGGFFSANHTDKMSAVTPIQRTEAGSVLVPVQRFQELADSVPILIWTASPDGNINYISQQITVFCGLSVPQILNDWLAVLHPADRAPTIATWQAALINKELYKTEYRIKRSDGAYIWHAVQATPVFDKRGQVKQWYGSSVDIHELKALQKQSEELANKLNNTIESITDAFITLDKNFELTYVNRRAATIAGKPPAELLNSTIWDFCAIGEYSPIATHFKEAMHSQQKLNFEEFIPALQMWLDIHVYPSPYGLTVYFTDVTQQHVQRQELQLLRTAVSRLNDIIIITEAEPLDEPGPRVVFVNEAFEKRTGYSKKEILGQSPRILQGEHTQRDKLDLIDECLRKWQPVRTQLINYTKDGEEFWLDLDIVPIVNEKGWNTHWVAVERDITEQKRIEQKLIQSQKMEALGHITGGIAHDFNNLLTVIMGNADLLTESLPVNSPFLPLAEIILNAANRGSQLTQSLLSFSSKLALVPVRININGLINRFKKVLETSLGKQHLLVLQLEQSLPDVMADEAYLESSLLNLVINARDAMPLPGRVTIHTRTEDIKNINSPFEVNRFVIISISDTGQGIEPDIQSRIFEPFFSTKQPGYGTGLGLSMVFGFIHQSGGEIECTSSPGDGSTFELSLPVLATETAKINRQSSLLVPIAKGWRMLLVEDDSMVRQYAVDVLSKAGFIITQAANGIEALEYLQTEEKFDIMFTDIVMPGGINGFELAEHANKLAPTMPVLFTSGYNEQTGKLNDLIVNENTLLRKPYRKAELLQHLNKLLVDSSKK